MPDPDAMSPPTLRQVQDHMRGLAMAYPDVREDFPWGHSAFKVRGKSFLFLAAEDDWLSLSVKLPQSRDFALDYRFTQPTGYGLGRSGWVSAKFGPDDTVPLDLLAAWLDESFRAIAPKALVKDR